MLLSRSKRASRYMYLNRLKTFFKCFIRPTPCVRRLHAFSDQLSVNVSCWLLSHIFAKIVKVLYKETRLLEKDRLSRRSLKIHLPDDGLKILVWVSSIKFLFIVYCEIITIVTYKFHVIWIVSKIITIKNIQRFSKYIYNKTTHIVMNLYFKLIPFNEWCIYNI